MDNTRGYESDNVVPCCKFCNIAKYTMGYEDFLSYLRRIAKHLEFQKLETSQLPPEKPAWIKWFSTREKLISLLQERCQFRVGKNE
jgi:hypothetical protein